MSMLKSVKLSVCQAVKFDPWDMLNNFRLHVYAPKSLFIAENDKAFFWELLSHTPLEFIEVIPI